MTNPITVDSALAAMSEAGAPAFSPENVAPKVANVTETAQPQEQENAAEPGFDENGDPVDPATDNTRKKTDWPKTAVNAFNRKTKTINHLKAQNETLATQYRASEARLAALELIARGGGTPPADKPTQTPSYPAQAQIDPNDPLPQENDVGADGKPKYANFGEFWDAKTRWNTRQAFAEAQKKVTDAHAAAERATLARQEEARISTEAQKFVESVPDAMQLLRDNADIIMAFSPDVESLLLQAENAPLAIYNLAKDGKLAQLNQMPLARAAFEIGRAMSMALPNAAAQIAPAQQISSAPNPPSRAANGTGTGNNQALENLSPRDLMKRMQAA